MESWSKKGQCSPAGTWPNSASQSWRWCWLSVWNLKSAAQTPNRTGDEIVVFFSLIFVFKEATTAVGGSRLCKNHCYMRCFCPVVLKSCFLQGLGLAGGWWSVRNCLFSKKPLQHWLFTSFCLSLRFLVDDSKQAMFSNGYVLPWIQPKAIGLEGSRTACWQWVPCPNSYQRLWDFKTSGAILGTEPSCQHVFCEALFGISWFHRNEVVRVCSGKEEQMTWPSPSPLQTSRNLRFRPSVRFLPIAHLGTFETLFFIQVERLGTEVKSQDPQFFSSQILQTSFLFNTIFSFLCWDQGIFVRRAFLVSHSSKVHCWDLLRHGAVVKS